jgi:hypothetical protein
VAILPYLEQQELYNQYNVNEPWDSENNKRLLTKMPAVFRHPSVPGIAGNYETSAYYVLTGKGAVFNDQPSKAGTKFWEIPDGTSNTILAVEAKRDIPWTKPEDIAFDADKELPKLGGFAPNGFGAAGADGAVRFLPQGIDQNVLKLLITMADGQAVGFEQVLAPQVRGGPPGAVLPPARAVAPPPRK